MPSSIIATGLSQPDAQSQDLPGQDPSTGDPNEANTMQIPGLGALIANAFGYVPSSIPSPINNPDTLDSEPEAVETTAPTPISIVVNGITTVLQPIDPSAFAIGGTAISAGGPGVIVAGTLISLQASSSALVIESSTLTLASQTSTLNAITFGN